MPKGKVEGPGPSVTTRLWPDATNGPWRLTAQWAYVGDRLAPVGLQIEPIPGSEPAELTASDLRTLRWAKITRELLDAEVDRALDVIDIAGQAMRDEEPWAFNLAFAKESAERALKQAQKAIATPRTGRPPYGQEYYEKVAAVYRLNVAAGDPTAAVARWSSTSKSAAAKWVAECRRRKLLPATTRGRPSGGSRTLGDRPDEANQERPSNQP